MTVGELIRELGKYATDIEVQRWDPNYGVGTEIGEVPFHAAEPARVLGGVKFGPDPAHVTLR